jgi:hypothetical protein
MEDLSQMTEEERRRHYADLRIARKRYGRATGHHFSEKGCDAFKTMDDAERCYNSLLPRLDAMINNLKGEST